MSLDVKIFDESGNVVFDITKHRLIRYIRTVTITADQWRVSGTNNAIWYASYSGVSPKTHMSTTESITVLTDKLQYYNKYNPLAQNPGNVSVDIYGI